MFPSYISGVHLLLLLRSPAIPLGFTFFFFCVPQLYLWGSPSSSSAFPSYISGFHLLLLLRSPAISLGFTFFFFFCVPQLYLWVSPSSSSAFPSYISGFHLLLLLRSPAISLRFTFFFCVPRYISGLHLLLLLRSPALSLGFTILGEIFANVTVFNPTIEVVTFCLCGWCKPGVFSLPAFTRLGHECQDLLSPCHGMHVCTD